MASEIRIDNLKDLLRHEVALLCQRDNRKWKSEIWKTVDEIRNNSWPAVFFGGTLRSLLISRIARNKLGHPRDVDIVFRGIGVDELKTQFNSYISRQTRFGGIQLLRSNYYFDLWPLNRTFAFKGTTDEPEFPDLPKTTFLNVEAIAIDVWPSVGKARAVYSGDDQFFKGILSQTLELNNENNPFPHLCVARALVIASDLQWKVGPRLVEYIRKNSLELSGAEFEDVQRKHYGLIRLRGSVLESVRTYLEKSMNQSDESVELPLPKQLELWKDDTQPPRFRITSVRHSKKTLLPRERICERPLIT